MYRAAWQLEIKGRTPRLRSEDYAVEPQPADPFTYLLRCGAISIGYDGLKLDSGRADRAFDDVAAAMRAAAAHREPKTIGDPDPPLLPRWHLVANRARPPRPFLKTDSEFRLEQQSNGYVVPIGRNRWVGPSGELAYSECVFADVLAAMRATSRYVLRRPGSDGSPPSPRRTIEPIQLYKVAGERVVTIDGYYSDGKSIYRLRVPEPAGSRETYELVDSGLLHSERVGYESAELAVETNAAKAIRAYQEAEQSLLRAHEVCAGALDENSRSRMERALSILQQASRERDAALALEARYIRKKGGRRVPADVEVAPGWLDVRNRPPDQYSSTSPRLRKRVSQAAVNDGPIHFCRAPRDASARVVDDCQRCQEAYRVARVRKIRPRDAACGKFDDDDSDSDDGLSDWLKQIADGD